MLGRTIKQFTAYDPFAKWTAARPYKRALAGMTPAKYLSIRRATQLHPSHMS